MSSYYYDLKDNEIIPEDWLNPGHLLIDMFN